MEPTRVVLPHRPHIPGDLAIALSHFAFRGQDDVAHQGPNVVAGVHARHRLVVDVAQGIAQSGQLRVNTRGAGDRAEVTGHQHLGLKLTYSLDRGNRGQRVAVTVATHRHQIGDVPEYRPKRVPAQTDPLVR